VLDGECKIQRLAHRNLSPGLGAEIIPEGLPKKRAWVRTIRPSRFKWSSHPIVVVVVDLGISWRLYACDVHGKVQTPELLPIAAVLKTPLHVRGSYGGNS